MTKEEFRQLILFELTTNEKVEAYLKNKSKEEIAEMKELFADFKKNSTLDDAITAMKTCNISQSKLRERCKSKGIPLEDTEEFLKKVNQNH